MHKQRRRSDSHGLQNVWVSGSQSHVIVPSKGAMGEMEEDVFWPELFRQYYDPVFLFAFTIKRTLKFSLSWIFFMENSGPEHFLWKIHP